MEAENFKNMTVEKQNLETRYFLWKLFHINDDTNKLKNELQALQEEETNEEDQRVQFLKWK